MVEIANREELRNWFFEGSENYAIAIGTRATLRSIPVLHNVDFEKRGEEKFSDILLLIFRSASLALLISVRDSYQEDDILFGIVSDVSVDADDAAAELIGPSNIILRNSPNAVFVAMGVSSVCSALTRALPDSAATLDTALREAEEATTHALRALENVEDPAFWREVSEDARALDESEGFAAVHERALWTTDLPDMLLDELMQFVSMLRSLPDDWQVWVDWYNDRIRGAPFDEALELKKALIPNEIWEQGPAVVNAEIARIIEEHERQKADAQDPSVRDLGGGKPPPEPPARHSLGGGDGADLGPASAHLFELTVIFDCALDDPRAGPALRGFSNDLRQRLVGLIAKQPHPLVLRNSWQVDALTIEMQTVVSGSVLLKLNGTLVAVAAIVTILSGLDGAVDRLDRTFNWAEETIPVTAERLVDWVGETVEAMKQDGQEDPVPILDYEIVGRNEDDVINELFEAEQASRLRRMGGDYPVQ